MRSAGAKEPMGRRVQGAVPAVVRGGAVGSAQDDNQAGRRAVFLDRDGVLNVAPVVNGLPMSPATVAELQLLPCVADACARLKQAGFLLVVVTNQPDIGRGKTSQAAVDAINDVLKAELGLDAVYFCPHSDEDRCDCRKPKPGLLTKAARHWGINLARSFMVGDRWRDVEAGQAAGCRTVFIEYGYRERAPQHPDRVAASLAAVASELISAPAGR
jgi:D-glycero-D-manno-heptose 1,7-bisphosphate phosphatase